MGKQTFILTLVPEPKVDCYFPRVEAERMANIICEAIEHKSCSFIGPVPFTITVARIDESADAAGVVHEYLEKNETPQVLEEQIQALLLSGDHEPENWSE